MLQPKNLVLNTNTKKNKNYLFYNKSLNNFLLGLLCFRVILMYSARLMFVQSYGLLPKKYFDYFKKLDEPDYYFYKLGKQTLDFWKNEFKDLDLVMETELIHIIHLVKRNEEHEVLIGIRLEDYDSS